MKTGKLYLVSVPIGNYDDITIRALKTLENCDIVACEEFKPARRLLANYKIDKELFEINEHNEFESSEELLGLIKSGKTAALISDCGTPLFSDPGRVLVRLCIDNKIGIIPIPGVSSLMTALTASGLNLDNFYYYGWLSPKKDLRRKELLKLRNRKELIALLETPYRLTKIAADIKNYFPGNKQMVIAYNLTQKDEKFFRGTVNSVSAIFENKKYKGEFVLLIDNR